MRVRGSSLCDVAVLTIDINSGLQPTTVESLKLLRKGQTRFIIALNKIDRLNSWKSETEGSIRQVIAKQDETAKETFDKRLREVRKVESIRCNSSVHLKSFLGAIRSRRARLVVLALQGS